MELLEEEPTTESAGIQEITFLRDIPGKLIAPPALLVELMLENETEAVIAELAAWLPFKLASDKELECGDSAELERPRVRALGAFPLGLIGPLVQEPKWLNLPLVFKVPVLAAEGMEPVRFSVRLNATMDRGTGSRFWQGGMLLAEWLWHSHCLETCDDLAGHRVLELGAGFGGLPSCLASRIGALQVTATDGVFEVWEQLARNVSTFGIETQHLRWGSDLPQSSEPADVVLFADCLYSQRGAQLLLQCISSCLAACPTLGVHGTLEAESRAGCQDFVDGMTEMGFTAEQHKVSPAVLEAVSKKTPKNALAEVTKELTNLQIWTWRCVPVALVA